MENFFKDKDKYSDCSDDDIYEYCVNIVKDPSSSGKYRVHNTYV